MRTEGHVAARARLATRKRTRLSLVLLLGATLLMGCGSTSENDARSAPEHIAASADSTPAVGVDERQSQLDALTREHQRLRSAREVSAVRVVRGFYAAIDDEQFLRAWSRLSPDLQSQFGGYEQWKAGYESAVSSEVEGAVGRALDAQGDRVDVRLSLRAVDVDACSRRVAQRFEGTWRLSRSSGLWRAQRISMRKTGGGTVRTSVTHCPEPVDPSSVLGPSPAPSYDPPSFDPPAVPYTRPRDSDYTDRNGTYNGTPTTRDFGSGRGSVGRCSDGTLSDSIGRPGACSHHGGVGP